MNTFKKLLENWMGEITSLSQAYERVNYYGSYWKEKGFKEVIFALPSLFLYPLKKELGSNLFLSSQDIHWGNAGAYTGEVSASMIREAGANFTLLGHPHRRETLEVTKRKLWQALEFGLKVFLFLTFSSLNGDLKEVRNKINFFLSGLTSEEKSKIKFVYYPLFSLTEKDFNYVQLAINNIWDILWEFYSYSLLKDIDLLAAVPLGWLEKLPITGLLVELGN